MPLEWLYEKEEKKDKKATKLKEGMRLREMKEIIALPPIKQNHPLQMFFGGALIDSSFPEDKGDTARRRVALDQALYHSQFVATPLGRK